MRDAFAGAAVSFLDEVAKIPAYMSDFIRTDDIAPGEYKVSLNFSLPDGWQERCTDAMQRDAAAAFADN